ncbi:TPA: hypothetical protein ACJJWP_001697 [Enterobacter roggenkampii]
MKANKLMTGEQLDELMTVAVNMQRDAETDCNRPSAMFAYAVQVAVLELRKVRNDASALAAENAGLKSKAAELVHEASEVYSAYNSIITEPDGDFMDMQTLQEMQCVETPATDAFLAEVRAQGVEQLALHMELNGYSNEAAGAREYAANLRKGVQS